jgi:hypothetical protein
MSRYKERLQPRRTKPSHHPSSDTVAAPGSAGDAPGFVRLQTWDGKVLQEQDIEAVHVVDRIRWSPTRVDVPLIAEWPLPGDGVAPAGSPGN